MGRWGSIAILAAVVAFVHAPSSVVAQSKGLGPFPVKVLATRYPLLALRIPGQAEQRSGVKPNRIPG